jgi:uncharacterized protein YndB with AHSA1/START domain
MQRLERATQLAAEPARVFAFLVDPDNLPRWQPGIRVVERLSPPPTVLGSSANVIRDVMGQAVAVTLTVTDLIPDRRLSLSTSASGFGVTVTADLEPAPDAGTRLTVSATVKAENPILMALEGMIASAGVAELDIGLQRLREVFAAVPEPGA